MESVMTVRLNGDMKERAAAIMRREGYTPSSAVRALFEYTVKHDGLPFEKSEKPDRDELRRRIERSIRCTRSAPWRCPTKSCGKRV